MTPTVLRYMSNYRRTRIWDNKGVLCCVISMNNGDYIGSADYDNGDFTLTYPRTTLEDAIKNVEWFAEDYAMSKG